MRFSKNLENVFPGLSLLRLGGHDFILLLERDAIPDPYFSIPSTPGKARFTSIRNSTSLSPALFVGRLFPSSLLPLFVRTRPTLFQSTDTNSLCRFTPTFSNKCWICVRPVDRRIASCWQDSSSVLPSISKLATLDSHAPQMGHFISSGGASPELKLFGGLPLLISSLAKFRPLCRSPYLASGWNGRLSSFIQMRTFARLCDFHYRDELPL